MDENFHFRKCGHARKTSIHARRSQKATVSILARPQFEYNTATRVAGAETMNTDRSFEAMKKIGHTIQTTNPFDWIVEIQIIERRHSFE